MMKRCDKRIKILMLVLVVLPCLASYAQGVNIALHKPVSVSSEAAGHPASNLVDGKISRTSTWQAASGKAPHLVEIDLKKYYTISAISVHSGIREEEKRPDEQTQAAGFWSVKNFKLQYWDDANWSDFPQSEIHENRLTTVSFNYSPAVTTYRIRLVCDDGEPISIMELEVFGKEAPNMPAPPSAGSTIQQQSSSTAPKAASITVLNKITGKSMKYVGYNQGYYMPGSNVSGWVEYSNVNSFRVWASLNAFVPQTAVQVDKDLSSVEEFDQRKALLRQSPEKNAYLKWDALIPLYDKPDSSSTNAMVFNYALTELKRLGVDVVLQISSTDFDETWSNKWKQWQRYYALAYYSAMKGDVTMFALMNEPNHRNAGPMKLDQWISAMQIVSDAVHCAVEDVNKAYHKNLVPRFVGPVTAGNNPEWWAAVAKNIRTDYHGKTIDHDLLEIFSTHSYNSPAVGYEHRIENIRKLIVENHPAGQPLPVVYTEIGRWMNAYLIDKEETMDDPSLFTEWAGIYANNMKNGGYGMWAFKFANTASGPYPRGIKSGHHFIWQGRRIVEDAYKNIAAGKPVFTSNRQGTTTFITDGNKSDASTWISDSSTTDKWVEINLGKPYTLGSGVIYSGDAAGVYTSPERIKNFRLQYKNGNEWKDIPGTEEKDNKYAQVFQVFDKPVTTDRVRLVSSDRGRLKLREIKLFAQGDGPSDLPSYDVSGIQRTGEVVRLFAKGFKDERPLFQTLASVSDNGLDNYTSYDPVSGNYYIWLVQRGLFDYQLTINLKDLDIPEGNTVTIETVGPGLYGEVSKLISVNEKRNIKLTLPPQTVMLLTIPKEKLVQKTISASAMATVSGGRNRDLNYKPQNELTVQLDAARPENNRVTYLHFNLPQNPGASKRILLKLSGYTNKKNAPFRLHVYGIPGGGWDEKKMNWEKAPLLDDHEALIKEVGQKAFVAGEIAFTNKEAMHWLDVTELVKRHAREGISFVLVRETRQLGDDEDKGFKVFITNKAKDKAPAMVYWTGE